MLINIINPHNAVRVVPNLLKSLGFSEFARKKNLTIKKAAPLLKKMKNACSRLFRIYNAVALPI